MTLEDVKQFDIKTLWEGEHLPPLRGTLPQHNPFRDEKEISLQVGGDKNIVYDYGSGKTWSTIDLVMVTRNCTAEEAIKIIRREYMHTPEKTKRFTEPTKTYDYRTPEGQLLYQVCRFENPKTFRQRRPGAGGRWDYSLGDTPKVLYRLPEVISGVAGGETIYVCEGEKDADTLAALGFVATTASGGAIKKGSQWLKSYSDALLGADVVILQDNDEAGAVHSATVARELFGIANSIKCVLLPDLPDKGDVSDYFIAGGSVTRFNLCVNTSPEYAPPITATTTTTTTTEDKEGKEVEFRPTDLGNAERFANALQGKAVFCALASRWYFFNGTRWEEDRTLEVVRAAEKVIKAMHATAALCEDPDEKKLIKKHATRSESNHAISSMISLAGAREGIPVVPEIFDSDPMILGVTNGVIDLRNISFRGGEPGDYITKSSTVAYDAQARCPRWEKFIDNTFGGDKDLISFVHRLSGYLLTGSVSEQKFFIFHGAGGNGKSVYLAAMHKILGTYASVVAASLLTVNKNESHPTGLADLQGMRMTYALESDDGKKLAENLVKSITGGDMIKARKMRQDFFEFAPTHKIILSTNHRPVINGTDVGIWRRILLVPFLIVVPPEKRIPDYGLIMAAEEGPGILNWCLEGLQKYKEEGLTEPSAVTMANNDYRSDMDVLGEFVRSCCVESPHAQVQSRELIRCYEEWCGQNGEVPLRGRSLADKLRQRGYQAFRTNRERMWKYIDTAHKGDFDNGSE